MSATDHLVLTLTDAPEEAQKAIISQGLGAYNDAVGGPGDYRPLAVFISNPETGGVLGGLFGGSYRGQLFIDRFFLPESLRGNDLGSRALAMAEQEARRRGCTRVSLFTISFQAPGFYLKQGYELSAELKCDPPGATRMLMTKRLTATDPPP
jgi:GNAT superfamily N-acetyltransferase